MRKIIKLFNLLFLLTFSINTIQATTAVVKVNVLRGEQMVTVKVPTHSMEKLIQEALRERGIGSSISCEKADFFVDAFVYQYPAEYPSILLTIRSRDGIHHSDRASAKLFVTRSDANVSILKKLCKRLPEFIDTDKVYELKTLTALESRLTPNLIHLTSNSVMKAYEKHYSNVLDWGQNEATPFIFHSFEDYLKVATNYTGIRKKIKKYGALHLYVGIDQLGRTYIKNIQFDTNLKLKEKERLHELVASFPIWIVEKPKEDVVISIGLN